VTDSANVELVGSAFENVLAGRSEWGAELLDRDVVWDASEFEEIPDIGGVHRGPEAVRKFWRDWLSAWETVQFDYELVEAGDHVVALIDQRMRGRSTGIEVPFGKYAHVYTFKEGLIVRWKAYRDDSEALKAVGLSE
jgi:ketosteroid isomerase-like protein